MEVERRFRVSEQEYQSLVNRLDWSPADRVCDLTFGPTGATSMQTDGWVVRLRRTGSGTRMENKAPRNAEWSAWVEYGTSVGSFAETARILLATGLRAGLLLDRTRRVSSSGDATLSLDHVLGLGRFIEIEVEVATTEDAQALKAIKKVQQSLGLLDKSAERPYGEMMLGRLNSDAAFQAEHDDLIKQALEDDDEA